MAMLLLAGSFFIGIHILISGTALRGVIVAAIGERPYQAVFSLLSIGGIVWLVRAYGAAAHEVIWVVPPAVQLAALALVFIGFLLVVIGLTTPTPTTVGAENLLQRREAVRGITRVSRHPFLCGVVLWALAHIAVNGDRASVVFFGSFFLLALIGPFLIDRKRRLQFGEDWQRFAEQTSIVPFAAILQGRNSFVLAEIGLWRIALAVAVFAGFFYFHPALFGVGVI